MLTLENEQLRVTIQLAGGELTSIFNKQTQLEYLWQADPAYWGRHAPVLFPIVGKLKDDQYRYAGENFHLGQHGFARDMTFEVVSQDSTQATLRLTSSAETKKVYPFDFELDLHYTLQANAVEVGYTVKNKDAAAMIFGIGGHPSCNVPLVPNLKIDDYYLSTTPRKSRTQVPLSGAYLDFSKRTLFPTNSDIDLKYDLFSNDAVVLSTPGANAFTIASDEDPHKVTLSFNADNEFPFTGIWTPYPKQAPFLCIEPWCGLADTTEATGDLAEKFAMNTLAPDATFNRAYQITVE